MYSCKSKHLINVKGPKYEKAVELNIPCVTPEFLKACEQQQKMQPATAFYIAKNI